ncbi:MAG: hypothetical protein SYNGOMJ08_00236 [Candidatus Syntrophoarchaeum sp. GoM_oil]|nr:MAG: hypothetical protein SYNGOMJ08_00236 [Candidatus Syntrophoarchaeum sp. GoM_oil]
MSEWIAWDVITDAMTKTRQMLFEPFDLTKWVKLAIILFFIGSGSLNFGSSSSSSNFGNFDSSQTDVPPDAFIEEAVSEGSVFVHQYLWYIVLAVLAILLLIALFSYISNVMQFAFVESVVKNQVTLKAYIRNNLGNGLRLFILNWALGILFLAALILSLLPAFSAIMEGDFSVLFFGSLLMSFFVTMFGSIIFSLIGSFINLAIPVMLYEHVGIINALSKVISTAVHSIPQVLVYWIIRIVLGIIIGIATAIIGLIVVLITGVILLLLGIVVYLILTLLGFGFPNIVVLVVLGLLFVVSMLVLIFLVTLATVPLPVFMKYHALLFLQNWYVDIVPFWEPAPEPAKVI